MRDVIASGLLTSSPTLATWLATAEGELARIEAARAAPQAKVARMLTGIAERYGAMVENLEHVALRD